MRHASNPQAISNALRTFVVFALLAATSQTDAQTIRGYMPDEAALHEGTWLQWPHHYTYGATYRNRLDSIWIAMTKALVQSERVHIVAYNSTAKTRITSLLTVAKVPLTNVNFLLRQTDDTWVRDNGPIFVYDSSNNLKVTDWGFNGWGFDTPYAKDNTVPLGVASSLARSGSD